MESASLWGPMSTRDSHGLLRVCPSITTPIIGFPGSEATRHLQNPATRLSRRLQTPLVYKGHVPSIEVALQGFKQGGRPSPGLYDPSADRGERRWPWVGLWLWRWLSLAVRPVLSPGAQAGDCKGQRQVLRELQAS